MVSRRHLSTAETHSGAVVFVGERAYKFKKAVDLGFLDFRDVEQRRAACRRELELNRRLAPDVYLGVAEVTAEDGSACEHLLVMRRMPDDRKLANLVSSDADDSALGDPIDQIARTVAAFHSTADRSNTIAAQGRMPAVRRRWREHFDDLAPFRDDLLDGDELDRIVTYAEDYLAGRAPLFDRRVDEGRIVDGHGDLLSDDIFCLADGPRVLDCLDFNDEFRWLDAADDVACLAMDLHHRSRPALADRLVRGYAEFSGDNAPTSLWRHYVAYRATMRAKVACLRHAQGEPAAAGDARSHAALALRQLHAGAPRLVLVGGAPGTGKTTIAGAIADRMGAVLLSSDRLRKELAGIDPTGPAPAAYGERLYAARHTEHTYRALTERAGHLLSAGESVVLDASWTRDAHRESARRTAEHTRSGLTELRCAAPREVAARRIRDRDTHLSDADEHIAAAMAADADGWPQATTIDTTQPATEALRDALDAALAGQRDARQPTRS